VDGKRVSREVAELVTSYAEEATLEFPPAGRLPVNIIIAYAETILYLVGRVRALFPYFEGPEDLDDQTVSSVRELMNRDLRTGDPARLESLGRERLAEYEKTTRYHEPLSEGWYGHMFVAYRDHILEAFDSERLFLWNLNRSPAGNAAIGREEALQIVHRIEVKHVVPLQRLVISFLNFQTGDR